MKNLLLLFMLVTISASAQFDRWAIGANFGVHSVGDESATVTDAFNHYGLTARYSINPIVSVGLTGGYDNLTLQDLNGFVSETNYMRISTEGFIDVFDILQLQNNTFTLLAHGGPGYSYINSVNYSDYDDGVFSLTGGATGLVKLSRSLAISLDARITSNVGQAMTLDGFKQINNTEINSTVTNFSLGLQFSFGKKGSKYEHADWYVAPPPIYILNNINNNYITREYVRNYTETTCECILVEFIFFDHDKDKIQEEGLNAITKIYTYLEENPDAKLRINGYASATNSSAEYNKELSLRRATQVADKLELMGADMNRVSIHSVGKDFHWANEETHDVSRRVELIIKH